MTEAPDALWAGDSGTLRERSRRAIVELVKGPYLARARRRELWEALLTDEEAIRSRLHDLFLDVVIDRENELAFVRPADFDGAPEVVRTRALTFMDTAMLLILRQALLLEDAGTRVFIGQEEVFEQLAVYRAGRDDADHRKRTNASWANMHTLGLLHSTEEGRAEISPIVRFLVDADRVQAITSAFARAAGREDSDGPDDAVIDGDDEAET